jgi:TDG/mug DNA glycosylase family protein
MPIQSFNAMMGSTPKILVLGSLPGIASLNAQQYYAHPRNAFWMIMSRYFGFDERAPYTQRLECLLSSHVALWDVLGQAERQGSLDSAIISASQIVNPIDEFARANPSLTAVFLNGGKAATSFKKTFSSSNAFDGLGIVALPSTSPAYAAMKPEVKKQHWHQALSEYLELD